MGMYTQLLLDVRLKKDTPKEVIKILTEMVSKDDVCEFWEGRLNWCFNSSSYYFNNYNHSEIGFDEIMSAYKLFVYCDFKNYGEEIEKFLAWLKPYIEYTEDMLGYVRYEEDEIPTILFVKDIMEVK